MINSWSFTRYQTFEQCPYRAKLQYIDKIPDTQPKPAADRGTEIHQQAEDFANGKITKLPATLKHFADEMSALKDRYNNGTATLEQEWGFDSEWGTTDWKRAWLRVKADATVQLTPTTAAVIDHKTGKSFGNEIKHAQQLQIYALSMLVRDQKLELVTAELWYLDQNELKSFTLKKSQISRYLKVWDSIGRKITTATEFAPKPNIISCRYCPYHANKQGDCKHGAPL